MSKYEKGEDYSSVFSRSSQILGLMAVPKHGEEDLVGWLLLLWDGRQLIYLVDR